jgi:putative ABC transport system permease protein
MLGVALAFSVALINASALSEFSQAVRSVNGQPDLELRAPRAPGRALYAARHDPGWPWPPVLELSTYAIAPGQDRRHAGARGGNRCAAVGAMAPALMPQPAAGPTGSRCYRVPGPAAMAALAPADCRATALLRCSCKRAGALRAVSVGGSVVRAARRWP